MRKPPLTAVNVHSGAEQAARLAIELDTARLFPKLRTKAAPLQHRHVSVRAADVDKNVRQQQLDVARMQTKCAPPLPSDPGQGVCILLTETPCPVEPGCLHHGMHSNGA